MRIADIFVCPGTEGHRVEEIMSGVVVASQVIGVGYGGDAEYGEQSNEDGVVERYQCEDFGWIVPGVRDAEELFDWLKDPNRSYDNLADGDE